MPINGYPHTFLHGLSDFWTRFFVDADQLDSMYQGAAILVGQAYLDLLSSVLNLSLKDAPVFNKEYYKLVLIREDQARFVRGASSADDRWEVVLTDGVVSFLSLDNRVIEPTVSFQQNNDYDLGTGVVRFKQDPTDPLHDGNPTPGFARRQVDIETGGTFDDSTRLTTETWGGTRGVYKGDVLRLLDVSVDLTQQRKRADYPIALVRDTMLYVDVATSLPLAPATQNYVILRRPATTQVQFEQMTFVSDVATLVHSRIDQGSVRVYAKRVSDGADVVEGVDYSIDYERGILYRTSTWVAGSANKIDYTWMQEVWPNAGGAPPRFSQTGVVLKTPLAGAAVTTRVFQMALWAPDALVDRMNLANNFGSLVGITQPSSENYRALLRGIFQLYLLGPVVERIESALNVILGLPVIRDDGEVYLNTDLSPADVNRITTLRPSTNTQAVYEFPKSTPLKSFEPGYVFQSFDPLTTAVTVTDYIQDPNWWHNLVIPPELFSTQGGAEVPSPTRRTASPVFIKHVIGAEDHPKIGDPGLKIGADEDGMLAQSPWVPAGQPGYQPVYRKRVAFVLMDKYLKFHTFFVRYDNRVFADNNVARYARSFDDLQKLVLSAKPAHTYAFATPATEFKDEVDIAESGYFQPPIYPGQDPDGPSIFADSSGPDIAHPFIQLGLFFDYSVASPPGGPDEVLFQDNVLKIGVNDWKIGDYFHYDLFQESLSFPTAGVAVALPDAPTAPRRRRLVRVFIDGYILAKRLVENVDYTVDYVNATITRLTTWDSFTGITVKFLQLNIGNTVDGAANASAGDMPLLIDGIDPANVRAAYDPAARDWMDNLVPVTDARDISLVERPLTIVVVGAQYTIHDTVSTTDAASEVVSTAAAGDPATIFGVDGLGPLRTLHYTPTSWAVETSPTYTEPDSYFPSGAAGIYAQDTSNVFALGGFTTQTDKIFYVKRDGTGNWSAGSFGAAVLASLRGPNVGGDTVQHTVMDIGGDRLNFIAVSGFSICNTETWCVPWCLRSTDGGATWTYDESIASVMQALEGIAGTVGGNNCLIAQGGNIYVESATSVWMSFLGNGCNGHLDYAHWNGTSWTGVKLDEYASFYTWQSPGSVLLPFGSTLFAGGYNFNNTTKPAVFVSTNSGVSFTQNTISLAPTRNGTIRAMAGTSATDIWVLWAADFNGTDRPSFIYHWDGAAWTDKTPPWAAGTDSDGWDIDVDAYGVYVVADLNIWQYVRTTDTWGTVFTDNTNGVDGITLDIV